MPAEKGQRIDLAARVAARTPMLTDAEARMARFFLEHKEAVILESAARIAEGAGGSDATVVRTAKSLGYSGLSELRENILSELVGATVRARRARRTHDTASESLDEALPYVVALHQSALDALGGPAVAASFARSLDLIAAARRRQIFGVGFLAALADYVSLRFNRLGFRTDAFTANGIALTDRLAWLEPDDVVLMMAYAPLDDEVGCVLDHAAGLGTPVVLISDASGPNIDGRVAETLPIPRGQVNDVAMHSVTMVLVEALILGLAECHGAAFRAPDASGKLRGGIVGGVMEHGSRRPQSSSDLRHISPSPARRRNGRDT